MKLYKKILISLISLAIIILPLSVLAAGIVICGGDGEPVCEVCHLFVGIQNIVNFLTIDLAFPLAVLAIIYGGIVLTTSGGSQDKIKLGRKAIESAIWGMIFVFASWLIIDTILKLMTMGDISVGTEAIIKGWGPWNKIPNCPL